MNIRFGKHAREQMIAREISENEIEEGIRCGTKELQKPNKILSYHRYFCVVYKKIKDVYYIITIKPR